MPEGPFCTNEGRYGTSLKVLGFCHSQRTLMEGDLMPSDLLPREGGPPSWVHAAHEPSEAPLHPLSTLCPHSKPEWVLFQPQDGGNQLKGPRQPWPGGKAVPQGPFSRRTSALAVLSCPAWKLKHGDCTTSCCHFCFSERIFSSFLKAVLSECAELYTQLLGPETFP